MKIDLVPSREIFNKHAALDFNFKIFTHTSYRQYQWFKLIQQLTKDNPTKTNQHEDISWGKSINTRLQLTSNKKTSGSKNVHESISHIDTRLTLRYRESSFKVKGRKKKIVNGNLIIFATYARNMSDLQLL